MLDDQNTARNGWPGEPGVPLNPLENGAHQITHASDSASHRGPWVLLWCAPERLWTDLFGNREPPEAMVRHRYVGPMTAPEITSPETVALDPRDAAIARLQADLARLRAAIYTPSAARLTLDGARVWLGQLNVLSSPNLAVSETGRTQAGFAIIANSPAGHPAPGTVRVEFPSVTRCGRG